jgi:hypothetical protein
VPSSSLNTVLIFTVIRTCFLIQYAVFTYHAPLSGRIAPDAVLIWKLECLIQVQL